MDTVVQQEEPEVLGGTEGPVNDLDDGLGDGLEDGLQDGLGVAEQYRGAIERAQGQFDEDAKGKDVYSETGLQKRLRRKRNKERKAEVGLVSKGKRRKLKRKLKKEARREARAEYRERTEGMGVDDIMGEAGEDQRAFAKHSRKQKYERKKMDMGVDAYSQGVARLEYGKIKEKDANRQRKKENAKLKKSLLEDAKRMGLKDEAADKWIEDQYLRRRTFVGGDEEKQKVLGKLDEKVEDNNRKGRNAMVRQRLKGQVKSGAIDKSELEDRYLAEKEASKDTKEAQKGAQDRLRKKRNAKLKKKVDKDFYKTFKEQSEETKKETAKKKRKVDAVKFNEALFEQLAPDGELGDKALEYWTAYEVYDDDSRKKRNAKIKKLGSKSEYQALKMTQQDWKEDKDAKNVADILGGVGMASKYGGKGFFTGYKLGAKWLGNDEFQDNALGTKMFEQSDGSWGSGETDLDSVKMGGGVNQAGAITAGLAPLMQIGAAGAGLADSVNKRHSDDFAEREMGKDGIFKNTTKMTSGFIKGGKAGMKIAKVFTTNPALAHTIGEVMPIFKIATTMVKLVEVGQTLKEAGVRLSKLSELRDKNKKGGNMVVRQALKGAETADVDLVTSKSMDMALGVGSIGASVLTMIPFANAVGAAMTTGISAVKSVKSLAYAIKESVLADKLYKSHKRIKSAWKGLDSGDEGSRERAEKYGKRILKTDIKFSIQALIHQARDGDSDAQGYLEAFGISPGAYDRTTDANLRKLIIKRIGATEDPETLGQQIKSKFGMITDIRYKIHSKIRGY